MTRGELEHAIRAACDLLGQNEVIVFGSQAILGEFPNAPAELRQSAEADIAPPHEKDIIRLDGSLGEDSDFHRTYGFYVQGVSVKDTAKLPPGWRTRAIRIQNDNTRNHIGWCLEPHDLAASKLAAFRDKDRDFVRVLIVRKMIKPRTLISRIRRLPVEDSLKERLNQWVDKTVRN